MKLIDWAARFRVAIPIQADCLDCDAKFSAQSMRDDAIEHALENKHFVCVVSAPLDKDENS